MATTGPLSSLRSYVLLRASRSLTYPVLSYTSRVSHSPRQPGWLSNWYLSSYSVNQGSASQKCGLEAHGLQNIRLKAVQSRVTIKQTLTLQTSSPLKRTNACCSKMITRRSLHKEYSAVLEVQNLLNTARCVLLPRKQCSQAVAVLPQCYPLPSPAEGDFTI